VSNLAGMSTALEDIPDLQGWVRWQVARFCSKGKATADEFDELIDQGVLILYELHDKWDVERCPKFSAYAISLFQNRLINYYHAELRASGRGHTKWHRQPDGKTRREHHYHGTVSLNKPESIVQTFYVERALTSWDATE
jgi:hypothetical protein